MSDIEKIQEANVAHFLEHGPGLSHGYSSFVQARDTKNGRILIGGLGGMGVGEMWFEETESHRAYPGYAEAKDVDSKCPMELRTEWIPNMEAPESVRLTRYGGDVMDYEWQWRSSRVDLPMNLLYELTAFVWAKMTEEQRTHYTDRIATWTVIPEAK